MKVTVIGHEIQRPPQVEDLWMTVQYKKFPSFILGCVYRHPHALKESFEYLFDIFSVLSLRKKPILILGDFNDDIFNPNNKIGNMIKTLHLNQLITKPTRITLTSSTLLDLVITNKPNFIIDSDVLSCCVGDHELLTVTIDVKKEKLPPIMKTFRSHENYTQEIFCCLILEEIDVLNNILHTDNVNDQVITFNNVFVKCLDMCAPFVTKEITRPPAPWIDNQLKTAMKDRDELNELYKSNRQDSFSENRYKTEKKRVKQMLSDKKKNYFKEEFFKHKGDIKGTWEVVNKIVPVNKKSIGPLVNSDDDAMNRANEFNEHFASVGKKTYERSQENIRNINMVPRGQILGNIRHQFRPQPVDMETLILVIKRLKPTNSCGSDGISFRFFIDSLPVTCFYILVIVNTSIVTGIYPDPWKHPYVVPVFKSGDPENVNNYRPISLLPIISKILEKIVANQLMDFLESNHLLADE